AERGSGPIVARGCLPVMAEMVCPALVQEAVSRGVSFAWGNCENKALSPGHMMERLEMAISELELALERSLKLPITDVSLLQRRKMIKCAYVQAMELLDKHKQQAAPVSQEQMSSQGVKRKRWIFQLKNVPIIASLASLNMDDVRKFEWFADCAGKFMRDVESGCSLRHYTFCNPIARHLLEGKTLMCHLDQGTQVGNVYIWPTYSEERGVEVVLGYDYTGSTITDKCFYLFLVLRLSESMDIVRIATECLQFLTPQFKLAAESAMGELSLLPNLLVQDSPLVCAPLRSHPRVSYQSNSTLPPGPIICCKASRHGVSSFFLRKPEGLPPTIPQQQCFILCSEIENTEIP
ncbi:hypothetical protein U9M48_011525, partial [Paspalum notatum var. saurae]